MLHCWNHPSLVQEASVTSSIVSHITLFLLSFSQLSALILSGKMWGSILAVVCRSLVLLHSTQTAHGWRLWDGGVVWLFYKYVSAPHCCLRKTGFAPTGNLYSRPFVNKTAKWQITTQQFSPAWDQRKLEASRAALGSLLTALIWWRVWEWSILFCPFMGIKREGKRQTF